MFFFGRDKGEEFTPDTQIPESTVSEWEEPTGEAKTPEAKMKREKSMFPDLAGLHPVQ